MEPTLDELYLTWLYSQVGSVGLRNRTRSHWSLVRQLFSKEFVWHIPNDSNRAEDGKDLRYEFLEAEGIEVDPRWFDVGCTMLELLIALSRKLSFQMDGEPRTWFWHLIEMLDLEQYSDRFYDDRAERKIDRALERVINRTYRADGKGGLFPLNQPECDQREVELWVQFNAYLLELL